MSPDARAARVVVLALACVAAACGAGAPAYEYSETVFLAADGSAEVEVVASVPALVALRGAALDLSPGASVDAASVRDLYAGEAVTVSGVEVFEAGGRAFVRVRLGTGDLARLSRVRGLAWSLYRVEAGAGGLRYRQVVGYPPPTRPALVWPEGARVAFRLRAPRAIVSENTPSGRVDADNTVAWEQPLAVRLRGGAIDLQVVMNDAPPPVRVPAWGWNALMAAALVALVVWRFRAARAPAAPRRG